MQFEMGDQKYVHSTEGDHVLKVLAVSNFTWWWCTWKWRDAHLKFDWIALQLPDTYKHSHFHFLSLHHALPSPLWLQPLIHAKDKLEEN